jgi:hypothetical protein
MPEWKQEIRKQLAALNLSPTREGEIIEELSDHLENLYEEIIAEGATSEKAYGEVLSSLNQSDLLAELRATERTVPPDPIPDGLLNSGHFFTGLKQDLRRLRWLLRCPLGPNRNACSRKLSPAIISILSAFVLGWGASSCRTRTLDPAPAPSLSLGMRHGRADLAALLIFWAGQSS